VPASLEVLIDYRVLYAGPTPEIFGYSGHHQQGCFHPLSGLFDQPSLESCESSSSSHAMCASSEFLRCSSRLVLSELPRLPGFLPSSRRYRNRPLTLRPRSGSTPSLCSVLRLSQPLDGLLQFRCCGLISSHCRVQGFSVQGFLPLRSPLSSSLRCAPMPLDSRRSPASRLPPLSSPTSRPYSAKRFIPPGRCLPFPLAVPLFGFLLLQAPHSP